MNLGGVLGGGIWEDDGGWWDLAVSGGSHQNTLHTDMKFSKNQ